MLTQDYVYNATIENVVDGDTVDAVVDLGFTVLVKIRFRLYGLDTMETNDKDETKRALGLKAKEFLKDKLLNVKVTLKSHKTDKYGRWLAEIYLPDGSNVNNTLLTEGLAVPYFGGAKV